MTSSSREFITQAGKHGYRITVTSRAGKGAPEITLYDYTSPSEPILPIELSPSPHATAGLSVSVGMSTPFGAQKVEVGVWCTLPCAPNEADIAVTYDRVASMVMTEADTRLHEALQRFFPELADNS